MSGILRNTLRLCKIPQFNTRFKSCDINMNNRVNEFIKNNTMGAQKFCIIERGEANPLYNLYASFTNKIILNKDVVNIADLNYMVASHCIGQIHVKIDDGITKKFHSSPVFIVKADEKNIIPVSTEIVKAHKTLFISQKHKLCLTRKDGEFTLQKQDSGETIIFNHSVVLEKKSNTKYNAEEKVPIIFIDNIEFHDTVLTSGKDEEEIKQTIVSRNQHIYEDANDIFLGTPQELDSNLYDVYHEPGLINLHFPMTASIEGSPQKIKIEKLGDTFTFYHKIDIKTYKEVITQEKSDEKSKIGKIKIVFNSGDLRLRRKRFFGSSYTTKYEVSITINFDSETPTLHLMQPIVKVLTAPQVFYGKKKSFFSFI